MRSDPFRRAEILLANRLMNPIVLPAERFQFMGIDFAPDPLGASALSLPVLPPAAPDLPFGISAEFHRLLFTAHVFVTPIAIRMVGGVPTLVAVYEDGHQGPPLQPHDVEANVTPEHVEALMDFARDNNQVLFVELAQCLGVPQEKLVEMWRGTRKRLGFKDEPPLPEEAYVQAEE